MLLALAHVGDGPWIVCTVSVDRNTRVVLEACTLVLGSRPGLIGKTANFECVAWFWCLAQSFWGIALD